MLMEAFVIGQIQALQVTAQQIQIANRQDPALIQIFLYVKAGWPDKFE